MKNLTKLFVILLAGFMFSTINPVMAQTEGGPWVIPAKYKAMKSTIKSTDPTVMTVGKELYNKHCRSCHGTKGLGDGTKSATLETIIPAFKDKAFQDQSDGEIYYQSFIGRNEMPNFEKKIIDEGDRWAVVNYIRSLK